MLLRGLIFYSDLYIPLREIGHAAGGSYPAGPFEMERLLFHPTDLLYFAQQRQKAYTNCYDSVGLMIQQATINSSSSFFPLFLRHPRRGYRFLSNSKQANCDQVESIGLNN